MTNVKSVMKIYTQAVFSVVLKRNGRENNRLLMFRQSGTSHSAPWGVAPECASRRLVKSPESSGGGGGGLGAVGGGGEPPKTLESVRHEKQRRRLVGVGASTTRFLAGFKRFIRTSGVRLIHRNPRTGERWGTPARSPFPNRGR